MKLGVFALTMMIAFATSTAYAQVSRAYFFKISKDGTDSYVLGTIHSGVALNELPANVLETLQRSKMVVGERAWTLAEAERELDPDSILSEIVSDRQNSRARRLGQESREKLLTFGLPKDFVDVLRPSDEFCPFIRSYAAYQAGKSIDFEITIYARKAGVPVEELENDSLRSKAMASANRNVCTVADLVTSNFVSAKERIAATNKMNRDYRAAELPILPESAELRYRNERWIPRIEALHANGSIFIFVGASHVMQPANILEMLRARGFKITRL
ncbi:hypothetical protein BH10BDE1_BH10BDE1_12760 [soil metagenome]